MKKIVKVAAALAGLLSISACVEDQSYMSGYASHGGYSYKRYQATDINSGYNSHYNKSNKQGGSSGGYSSHQAPPSTTSSNRWYRGSRTNNPPVGYQGGRTFGRSGSNTYSGGGYAGSSHDAPPSTKANESVPPSTTTAANNINSGYSGR